MEYILSTLGNLVHQTAFFNLTWGNYLMILVALFFMYLAIKKEYEPLLLVPISFGMLLVNLFPDIMLSIEDSSNGVGGLLHYFYLLDEWSILPSLIFLGVGAMTDFGPLILGINMEYLGSVPQDSTVRKAVMKQKPVTIVYPNSFAARHFRYIAEELLGNEGDAPMHKKGIRSYFKNVFSRKM